MPLRVNQVATMSVLPDPPQRAVEIRPKFSHVKNGNYCVQCGGMMVQTGTCETCTSCGNTSGCG